MDVNVFAQRAQEGLIYDPLIRFLADIRKDFVKNFRYFLPIVIGVGLGFILYLHPASNDLIRI